MAMQFVQTKLVFLKKTVPCYEERLSKIADANGCTSLL